jgi:hypothetical protein
MGDTLSPNGLSRGFQIPVSTSLTPDADGEGSVEVDLLAIKAKDGQSAGDDERSVMDWPEDLRNIDSTASRSQCKAPGMLKSC